MVDIITHSSFHTLLDKYLFLELTLSIAASVASGKDKPFILPVVTAAPDIVVRPRLFSTI